jgi:hypothetical protein
VAWRSGREPGVGMRFCAGSEHAVRQLSAAGAAHLGRERQAGGDVAAQKVSRAQRARRQQAARTG